MFRPADRAHQHRRKRHRTPPPGHSRPVDTFRYGNMMAAMARAATTSDVFNAIAAPQRREVVVLRDRKAGKQRLYGLDARGLRPVHEWTGGFERFWNESFDRLDTYVQDLKQTRQEE